MPSPTSGERGREHQGAQNCGLCGAGDTAGGTSPSDWKRAERPAPPSSVPRVCPLTAGHGVTWILSRLDRCPRAGAAPHRAATVELVPLPGGRWGRRPSSPVCTSQHPPHRPQVEQTPEEARADPLDEGPSKSPQPPSDSVHRCLGTGTASKSSRPLPRCARVPAGLPHLSTPLAPCRGQR